jgi:hypothetical protein
MIFFAVFGLLGLIFAGLAYERVGKLEQQLQDRGVL